MPGGIEMKLLVKSLGPQEMGRGTGGDCGTFALTPHGRHVVSPGQDSVFPHIKKIARSLWWRTLPAISKYEFVVPPMGLDQLTQQPPTPLSGGTASLLMWWPTWSAVPTPWAAPQTHTWKWLAVSYTMMV